jgi:O-antigen chain-terminating methyltransferase
MSQTQNIEEIMQRIRAQVRKSEPPRDSAPPASSVSQNESIATLLERIRSKTQAGSASVSTPGSDGSGEQKMGRQRDEMAGAELPPLELKFHELSQLRAELATAQEGSRQTGQLNPRNPGLINNLLQFVKKVMKRSLTWYTRPLHLFQAGVIRGFQQIIGILENYRDQMRGLAHRSNLLSERLSEQLRTQRETIERESARVDAQGREFQQEVQQLIQRIESRFASSEAKWQQALQEAAQSDRIAEELQILKAELQAQRHETHAMSMQLQQAMSRNRVRERDMRRLVHAVEQSGLKQEQPATVPVPPMFPSEVKNDFEFDYFVFEDQYRGDETDVRRRQEAYLDYFRGRDNVIDIGCGRGEFLELLRDNNISARGVELGTDQYLLCKEKGFDVVQQDLFEFLEASPDESLGGILSAQVIEHMTASDQLRYVSLAYRKTKPGSPVIFETINPQCVYALVRNFFLDPTHIRPIHPETLKFAMESAKFRNVELRFSGPASYMQIPPLSLDGGSDSLQQFNSGIERLNELLYGYQDYAAVGWK